MGRGKSLKVTPLGKESESYSIGEIRQGRDCPLKWSRCALSTSEVESSDSISIPAKMPDTELVMMEQSQILILRRAGEMACSAVKNVYCSGWGPTFGSQHPYQGSLESSVVQTPGHPSPSDFCRHLHICSYTYTQTYFKLRVFLILKNIGLSMVASGRRRQADLSELGQPSLQSESQDN